MIDWLTQSSYANALVERPDRTASAVAAAVRDAPCFQNAPFPLSPLPLFATHGKIAPLLPSLERYVALLGKIGRLYREEAEVRRWYGLGPAAEALIAADRRLDDTVPVCRLDGYLEQGSERLFLLENNADAPAGTMFSPRINHVVGDALHRAGVPRPALAPMTYSATTAMLDVLLDLLRQCGLGAAEPRLAVLQYAGRANRESHEMADLFQANGVRAIVADPRDLRLDGNRVFFGKDRVDACWNKVNTVGWRSVVESDPELVNRWVVALSGGDFVHVNPFSSRYVAESKLTLAMPREPRFASMFTAAEHDLVDSLLPWARRMSEEATAADGATSLFKDVLDRQCDYVLKEPYDIRGDGVTVGRAVSRVTWESAVARGMDSPLLAQHYVAPTAYPVVRVDSEPRIVCMPTSFDVFVLAGRVRGFGSKASLNPRLNVFQGGQKLAVYVTPERAEEGLR